MTSIKLQATVGEDRRLVIDLPPEVPVGEVEIEIRPQPADLPPQSGELTREEARARLLAAGALVTWIHAPEGTVPLTPEELLEVGTLPPGATPTDQLIFDDREERF